MKNADWIFLPAGLVLAAVTSALTANFSSGRANAAGEGESSSTLLETVAELERSIAVLKDGQRELRHAVELAPVTSPRGARTEVGGVDAAVERWMRANASVLVAEAEEDAVEDERGAVEDAVQKILNGTIGTREQHNEFWMNLRNSGLLDGVIAELERVSEASPRDPDIQAELAGAYLQKAFALGPGPMQAIFNEKTDAAFDRALELDDAHWDARFGKAIALSNWPSFLGKAGAAIQNFETLMDQQELRPVESRFVQTYFFLGNMYEESGQSAKALATWRRGAELFPENPNLLEQISTFEGRE